MLTLVCSLWGDLDTRKTVASKLASLKPVAKAFILFINWSHSAGDGIKFSLGWICSPSWVSLCFVPLSLVVLALP